MKAAIEAAYADSDPETETLPQILRRVSAHLGRQLSEAETPLVRSELARLFSASLPIAEEAVDDRDPVFDAFYDDFNYPD